MSGPPGKREGALLQAPIPKLTGLPESNSGFAIRQACRHDTTRVEQMPQGHTHYAREVCVDCGHFIRWLPRPETIERRQLNAVKLAKLALSAGLNAWQRNFIRDLAQLQRLSPRQQCKLDEIAATHLKGELAS